jgi:hypothetical protein
LVEPWVELRAFVELDKGTASDLFHSGARLDAELRAKKRGLGPASIPIVAAVVGLLVMILGLLALRQR